MFWVIKIALSSFLPYRFARFASLSNLSTNITYYHIDCHMSDSPLVNILCNKRVHPTVSLSYVMIRR